jgi:hypothetical protein
LTELSLYFKILEDSKVRAHLATTKTRCKDLFNTTINITALQEMYERYFCRNQRLPKRKPKAAKCNTVETQKNHLSN